jgi:hypothetical protein
LRRYKALFRPRFLAGCVMWMLLTTSTAKAAGSFLIKAEFQNGEELTGTINSESVEFEALTPSGEVVNVTVKKPPEWSKAALACEIEWNPKKKLFIVRDMAWTGEVTRVWKQLFLVGNSGNPAILPGSNVLKAQFVYVEDSKTGTRKN